MRTFLYTLVGLLVLAGLFLWGWVEWSKEQVRKFRASKIASIQDSQRGRRPMLHDRVSEPRKQRER